MKTFECPIRTSSAETPPAVATSLIALQDAVRSLACLRASVRASGLASNEAYLAAGRHRTSKPGSEVGERPAMSEALSSDASGL